LSIDCSKNPVSLTDFDYHLIDVGKFCVLFHHEYNTFEAFISWVRVVVSEHVGSPDECADVALVIPTMCETAAGVGVRDGSGE
jgi:hypothetical protein